MRGLVTTAAAAIGLLGCIAHGAPLPRSTPPEGVGHFSVLQARSPRALPFRTVDDLLFPEGPFDPNAPPGAQSTPPAQASPPTQAPPPAQTPPQGSPDPVAPPQPSSPSPPDSPPRPSSPPPPSSPLANLPAAVPQPPPIEPTLQATTQGDIKVQRFITSELVTDQLYTIHVEAAFNVVQIRTWVSGARWYNRAIRGPSVRPNKPEASLEFFVNDRTPVAIEVTYDRGGTNGRVSLTTQRYSRSSYDRSAQASMKWPFGWDSEPGMTPSWWRCASGCVGDELAGPGGRNLVGGVAAFPPFTLGMAGFAYAGAFAK